MIFSTLKKLKKTFCGAAIALPTFYRLQQTAQEAEKRAADDFIVLARKLLDCKSLYSPNTPKHQR